MANPAETNGLAIFVQDLYARLVAAERRLDDIQRGRGVYIEEATVTGYSGGNQCTVAGPSGVPRLMRFLETYTPVAGHDVIIVHSPARSFIAGRLQP